MGTEQDTEGWGECGDSQADFTDESKESKAKAEGKQRAEIRAEVLRHYTVWQKENGSVGGPKR